MALISPASRSLPMRTPTRTASGRALNALQTRLNFAGVSCFGPASTSLMKDAASRLPAAAWTASGMA